MAKKKNIPDGGTHNTRDFFFPGGGTHNTWDMCFPGGETHNTRDIPVDAYARLSAECSIAF